MPESFSWRFMLWRIYRAALKIVKDPDDAWDLAQDVAGDYFRAQLPIPEEHRYDLLRKLLRSRCMARIRNRAQSDFIPRVALYKQIPRKSDRLEHLQPEVLVREYARIGHFDPIDPAVALEDAESSVVVRRAIDALPDKLREPLTMWIDRNMKFYEIAYDLGLPLDTVLHRLRVARRLLRRRLSAWWIG